MSNQVFQVLNSLKKIGPIAVDLIFNSKLVFPELSNFKQELENIVKKTKGKKKNFQIGVYIIYVEVENILYVGATKYYKNRIADHKAALSSYSGHVNPFLQSCYNKIKQEKKISHFQIVDNYFQFVPLFCYEINCSEDDLQARSKVDFIIQTLEPKVKQAFLDTKKVNVINIGGMLTKEYADFQTTTMSPEKADYYSKLRDLAAAQILESEGKVVPNNLINMESFSINQQTDLKNASRKIRPIVSIKTGQFFSSYKQICETNWFDLITEDSVSLRVRSDDISLDEKNRDLRFASNQEILAKEYMPFYNSVENPGRFNSKTTTFAKKSGVVGPKFPAGADKNNLSDEMYSKLIEKNNFSCTAPKTFYISKADASIAAKVSPTTVTTWISRDTSLYKEYNMPVIWRNATQNEVDQQSYFSQTQDIVQENYDFSLENTLRIKTDRSLSAVRANKGLIGPDKETDQPKFLVSSKEAQKYYKKSDNWIKSQMRDSEIAFLQNKTSRKFRTASLEENNSQSYIEKYDKYSLTEILDGLPKGKYRIDADIANFKID